jgi:DNA-binding transcriptional MerR regulator
MKIGQAAAESGVSIDTIRFYEQRGVLPTPPRTPAGYRQYDGSVIARIQLARRLQGLGLTLDEIAAALQEGDAGHASCETQRWRLEAALERIEARIAELNRLRGDVREALAACEAGTCGLATPADAALLAPPDP